MAFGLERLNQWAKTIGATLKIGSASGRGTVVAITVSFGERKGESYD